MSGREVVLKAEARELTTRGKVNELRREGKIPAVLYGEKEKNVFLVVDSKEFYLATHTEHGEHAVISLQVNDGDKKKTRNVIVKETQIHPVSRNVLHVDFLQISLTQEIEVTVAVETTGLAQGVDVQGGVLDQVTREVKIKCLPTAIPDKIEIDVTSMNIGDSMKISDLKVSGKVEILEDPERIVATIIQPTIIEEKPSEEEVVEGEEGAAEPEVIEKGKKEAEGEGEAEAEGGKKGKPEAQGKPDAKDGDKQSDEKKK